MLEFVKNAKARRQCASEGHDWKPDGTVFDCDGGMSGGRELQKLKCARCGTGRTSVFGGFAAEPGKGPVDA